MCSTVSPTSHLNVHEYYSKLLNELQYLFFDFAILVYNYDSEGVHMKLYQYKAPFGLLSFGVENQKLVMVSFDDCHKNDEEDEFSQLIRKQFDEYFLGERFTFDIPLELSVTPFAKSVYSALCDIPYGETWSYGKVASYIGNTKASRAVGGACNRNPIAIVIPCHRVIGGNGKLVGFGGGIPIKEFLLSHERNYKTRNR